MRRGTAVAAATVVTVAAVSGGVALAGRDDGRSASARPPAAEGTPLALVVARAPFCDRVADSAVRRALGGDAADTSSYASGQQAQLTADVRDVAHEFSCTFTAADGTTARGWVFAPPVTHAAARRLVSSTGGSEGCAPLPDAAAYGAPTVASVCRAGGRTTVAYRGLFGDAWLSCTLESPGTAPDPDEVADRAGRWCAAVAVATSAGSAGEG